MPSTEDLWQNKIVDLRLIIRKFCHKNVQDYFGNDTYRDIYFASFLSHFRVRA